MIVDTRDRAVNAENMEMNKVKNQVTGEYGPVPDTARYYKVRKGWIPYIVVVTVFYVGQ